MWYQTSTATRDPSAQWYLPVLRNLNKKKQFYFSKLTETRPDEHSQKKKKIKMLPIGGDLMRHFLKSPCSGVQHENCTISRADPLVASSQRLAQAHPYWCFLI